MNSLDTVTFAGATLDRAGHLRGAEAQAKLISDATARATVSWRGKPLFETEPALSLAWLPMTAEILKDAQEAPIFLGLEDGAPRYAFDISTWEDPDIDENQMGNFLDQSENKHPALSDTQAFMELRAVMAQISGADAGNAATAKGIFGWHETHPCCAKCGAETRSGQAGWQRNCTSCDARHFPRTDPVVIMLIVHGNRVLLGRSPHWPESMYSLLAGFMEPGEDIETAVRREVFEESGIRVGDVGYLASQPWPFPASLMIGCWGLATTEDITLDPVELEDALWVTREELMAAQHEESPRIKPAREGSIAHYLIHRWLRDDVKLSRN